MHAIEFTSLRLLLTLLPFSSFSILGVQRQRKPSLVPLMYSLAAYRSNLRASGAKAITKSMRGINLARGFWDLSRLLAFSHSRWRKKTRARRVTPAHPTIHDTKRRTIALFSGRIPYIPDTGSISYFYKLCLLGSPARICRVATWTPHTSILLCDED